jgi:NAD(P)-dependent dehydrogenase (short-subunit alcohol dehydrogenase family)
MQSEISQDEAAVAAGLGFGLLAGVRAALRRRSLRGQVALITGGSRGLGLALARAFGGAGCKVAICARDEETLERARASLAAAGIPALALPCDVTDRAQVARLVDDVSAHFGRVDIVVANAVSAITVGPVEALRYEDFTGAHDVLYWGVVHPVLAALPQMRARHSGRIVVVSSIGGRLSVPHMLPYSAAKHAALGFAAGLRAELAGSGVSVTTVAPGTLRTGAHLHASYAGRPLEEFTWFAKGELMPLLSVGVDRAARVIVAATAARRGELIFPRSAALMAALRGIFPNTVDRLLGAVNRVGLPRPRAGEPGRGEGIALEPLARDPLLRLLTRWRRPSLRRLNQYPDAPVDRL